MGKKGNLKLFLSVHIMVMIASACHTISADQQLTAVEAEGWTSEFEDTCTQDENVVMLPIDTLQRLLIAKGSSSYESDVPKDCTDVLYRNFGTENGEYMILPQNAKTPFPVYCDLKTDYGGWTVFQRREDGSVNFYQSWKEYETGFGNVNSEHWLGNTKLHQITAQGQYELRIDMTDSEGNSAHAKYAKFRIGDASTKFKLILGRFTGGDAGDGLSGHKNMAFSTRDEDNDVWYGNCSHNYYSGWWFYACHRSNLNGLYHDGPHESHADGVNWIPWKGYNNSLAYVDMKIRRV